MFFGYLLICTYLSSIDVSIFGLHIRRIVGPEQQNRPGAVSDSSQDEGFK